MPRVSASMIVRDEEATIADALRSLRALTRLDEVVVLDTGSTDRTVEIARDLGAVVHNESWKDDFALHRNHCLDLCRNDWVFIIDGDEVLAEAGDLDDFLEAPTEAGAMVRVDCVRDGAVAETFASLRLFDRRVGRWKYPVHNQVVGIHHAAATQACLLAHYDDSVEPTTERRLAILFEHEKREPDDPHYAHFIVKGSRTLRRHEDVVSWGNRYFDIAGDRPQGAAVCWWMIEALMALGERQEALELLELGLQRYPGYPDLHHWQLSLAALRWYVSARASLPELANVPVHTTRYADALPEAARLLGLPLAFASEAATMEQADG